MNTPITITTQSIIAPSNHLLHLTPTTVYLDATRAGVQLHKQDIFAPTWALVMGYQRGRVTAESYTKQYHQQMRRSYRAHRQQWVETITASAGKRLVIGCFCRAGAFCHRHLLAGYLAQAARQLGYRVVQKEEGGSS